jgi:hypothetical protein
VVETELRRGGEDAFVIRTDERDFQSVLPTLAYALEGEEEARASLRRAAA